MVRAPRIKKEAVETRIRTEEARRVPGTQGDTLKVVQNLPGVARSSFGSGDAHRLGRGAQRDQGQRRRRRDPGALPRRRLALDDQLRSGAVDRSVARLVRRRLRPRPRRPGADRARAAPQARGRTATSPPTCSTPRRCSRRRSRRACGWRSPAAISYLDQLLPLVTSADVGDFVPIPRYDDYQARATLSLRPDEELALTFLASDDHLQRAIPSSDPAEVRAQNIDSGCKRRHPPLRAPAPRRRVGRRDAVVRLRQRQQPGAVREHAGRRQAEHLAVRAARRLPAPGRPVDDAGVRRRHAGAVVDARPQRFAHAARRARGTSSSSASRPATTSPPITGTSWSSTPPPTPSPRSTSGGCRWSRGCASSRCSSKGARRCPAGGTTPPRGYASFSLPENPVDEVSSNRYLGALRYLPQPAHRGRVPRHPEADADRRGRHLRPAARSAGHEPGVRQPHHRARARGAPLRRGSTTSCARR